MSVEQSPAPWATATASSASWGRAAWPWLPRPRLKHEREVAIKVLRPEICPGLGAARS